MVFKIGKRNIKTAIAVSLSISTAKILRLEYPFFAAIAAIFSMENSISNSFKAAVNRLLGTLVGASIGLIFVFIRPGDAILSGLGTMLLIFICNIFKWDKAIAIAGIVFASIMLTPNLKNPISYSIIRVIETLIGIVIALLVNSLIFPPSDSANN